MNYNLAKMNKHDHTQMIYGLKVHTLNTIQSGKMDRYLMAFILCYLFGYNYVEMRRGGIIGQIVLPSNKFIKKVVSRIREERGISEIWIHDTCREYNGEDHWWEGQYLMLKCT